MSPLTSLWTAASTLLGRLTAVFDATAQWLFEQAVVPVLFSVGLGNLLEEAYTATIWLVAGLTQLVVIAVVFGTLQRYWPVERITDRGAVRLDMLYTAIHRLGVFRLGLFFLFDPLWDSVAAQMRLAGLPRWQLDAALAPLWPGVTDTAVFALAAYLLLFDFADYWIHRGQHGLRWWWGLHALHHAQRQMTMWSDNRNHLLDALLRDSVLVLLASGIGIAPGQFIAVVVCTQLLESLSHANVRMHFGSLGDRLLVSPRFHREHHSIHFGEPGRNAASVRASGLGGRNFAILFPVWDLVFRTGCWADRYDATGVHDQLPGLGGRDYGRGFWSQQWLGLRRMMGRA